MRKNLTISAVFTLITLSLSLSIFSASDAFATDNFFIEIGSPSSIEEVNQNWNDLSTKYKTRLGKLTLFPKSIVDEQGKTSNIIQAGPIAEKDNAQRICNILFAKDINCFVIEGIEGKPPTMSIGMVQATSNSSTGFSLPWLNIGAAPVVLADNGEEETSSAEADVDVAEAISVPLSDNTSSVTARNRPMAEQRKPINVTRELPLIRFSSDEAGKLIIGTFTNENEAHKFWNYANEQHSELIGDLSVRIQKPLMASNRGGIQVSIGQFANGGVAANFCNQTISGFSTTLKCRYAVENDVFSGGSNSNHSNKYEQRRTSLERRSPEQQTELLHIQEKSLDEEQSTKDTKEFWAQVAISDSKEEAQYRLKEIQKTNKKVIGDISSAISYSASAEHGKYAAKLGTFSDEREAQAVCDKLLQRGVDCLVVSR